MNKNRLLFFLEPKIYPYSAEDGKSAKFIKWGSLKIVIVSNSKQITLLKTEWDLLPLIKWFEESEQLIRSQALKNDCVGLDILSSESIAQALNRLQEEEFGEDQEDLEEIWFDALFEFRKRHSLRFGLCGSKVPGIIIGCNNGIGEISLSNKNDEWSYIFDIDEFFIDFKKKAFSFIQNFK